MSPSRQIMTQGRWNSSARREAAMPMTPWCQPSLASTMGPSGGLRRSSSCDCSQIPCSSSWRSRFMRQSSCARGTASAALAVSSSLAASSALPSRPAALSRGAMVKPTVVALTRLALPPHSFISAATPGRAWRSICSRPRRTIYLFSPVSGMTSATVPAPTRSA